MVNNKTKTAVAKKLTTSNFSCNSGHLLDFPNATTKIINKDSNLLNIKKNKSSTIYSSSPIKKYDDIRNITDDSCSYDFSQIESYKTKQPEKKSSIELLLQNNKMTEEKKYCFDVNEKVTNLFKKIENNRTIDLNLQDISFGTAGYYSPKKLTSKRLNSKFLYNSLFVESIIEIQELEHNTKQSIVSQLTDKLINSQTGKRKYKVIILTPRTNASWFQRKLKTFNIKIHNSNSEFIIVKVKKSFTKFLKDCINELS